MSLSKAVLRLGCLLFQHGTPHVIFQWVQTCKISTNPGQFICSQGKSSESVQCAITGPCLCMCHSPSAQRTVPIRNICRSQFCILLRTLKNGGRSSLKQSDYRTSRQRELEIRLLAVSHYVDIRTSRHCVYCYFRILCLPVGIDKVQNGHICRIG